MVMALPKDIPTLEHMVTKKYSRPDNVFCTDNLPDYITNCDVLPGPSHQHRPLPDYDHIKLTDSPHLAETLPQLQNDRMEGFQRRSSRQPPGYPTPHPNHLPSPTTNSHNGPNKRHTKDHQNYRADKQALRTIETMVELGPEKHEKGTQ